jgi:hypothetical protein
MITSREGVLYPSAARTATPTAHEEVKIMSGNALTVVVNCTASSSTPSVVFKIQGKSASGVWYDILSSAAVTGAATVVMRVGPALTAVSNLAALHPLPSIFQVVATHADSDSITYSVDYCVM